MNNTRFLFLFIAVAIAFGVQLLSFSTLIDGKVNSDQNFLKNHINYFVSICGIAFSILAYVLGGYFTRDIVWHLNEKPGNKRFNKAWGFAPDLPSVLQGIHIGGLRWIIVGVALSLLAAFSIVRGVWLTLSIRINPHVTNSPPRNISFSSIHGYPRGQFDTSIFLASHVAGAVVGLKDSSVIHRDDDGEYIWSPWLIDNNVTEAIIEDYMTVGLRPKCTLLDGSHVALTDVNNTVTLTIGSALYNTPKPTIIEMKYARMSSLWRTKFALSTLNFNTFPNYFVSYQVFTTIGDLKNLPMPPTIHLNRTVGQSDIYVYGCKIDINLYNISGIVTSNPGPSLDRLTLRKKTLVTVPVHTPGSTTLSSIIFNNAETAIRTIDALAEDTATEPLEICVPVNCWMYDSIPGIYTGYDSRTNGPATDKVYLSGWVNMTAPLLEYKIAQLVGYTFSPTALTNSREIMAQAIIHDFITETIKPYIWLGVIFQLVLILVVIGLYITAVSDFRDCHGADLNYLVSVIKKDYPLENYPLKTGMDKNDF
ncbi:hypothetical protein BGX27_006887 [Mortierella sp. AM989]|nr:hypothetical protein BGX27_006887 [Mortierella sp. AM989]